MRLLETSKLFSDIEINHNLLLNKAKMDVV